MTATRPVKPLGHKAYGSIPHLPTSRMGPADHSCHEGQARIATERARDSHDMIVVQEKLDGSACAVAKVDGTVIALGRAGYPAESSPHEQHHMFARWVAANRARFAAFLGDGERVVGEWLVQAHGTRYELHHEPFVAFDIMWGQRRAVTAEVVERAERAELPVPHVVSAGPPVTVLDALTGLGVNGRHGAIDPIEGAVWRIERKGKVDFLCKYVRPDKVDGCYLPEVSGGAAVWNWGRSRDACVGS